MKHTIRQTALIILSAALLLSFFLTGCSLRQTQPLVPFLSEGLHGIMISDADNNPLFYQPDFKKEEAFDALSEQVDLAIRSGADSVFLETRHNGRTNYTSRFFDTNRSFAGKKNLFSSFDLIGQAATLLTENQLSLYAMIDPFAVGDLSTEPEKLRFLKRHPEDVLQINDALYLDPRKESVRGLLLSEAKELITRYPVAGIVYCNINDPNLAGLEGYLDALSSITTGVAESIRADGYDRRVFLETDAVNDDWQQETLTLYLTLRELPADLLFDLSAEPDDETLRMDLNSVVSICSEKTIPMHSVNHYQDLLRLEEAVDYYAYSNLLCTVKDLGIDQFVLTSNLKSQSEGSPSLGGDLFESLDLSVPKLELIDLGYPQTLAITRPAQNVTLSTAKYFVMGTSDPTQPLTINGEELERSSTTGLWGKLIELKRGANRITVRQGSNSDTVVITLPSSGTTTPKTIKKIQNSSSSPAFPSADTIVWDSKEFELVCVGPSGGSISATISGKSFPLKQVAATAMSGIAATYKASITLSDLSDQPQDVRNLGPVEYHLSYLGVFSSVSSNGSLYYAGSRSEPVIRVTEYMSNVYETMEKVGTGAFLEFFKEGTRDYVSDQSGNYLILRSGGIIAKSDVSIEEGSFLIHNTTANAQFESSGRDHYFRFPGILDAPIYWTRSDDGLEIVFHNTETQILTVEPEKQQFITAYTLEAGEEQDQSILRVRLEPDKFWGFESVFTENGLTLHIKERPILSDLPGKPLDGIRITLDPGHGGSDVGALGVAGLTGPDEADVNMAITYVVQKRLEDLGASVTLTRQTRDQDKNVLMDRLRDSAKTNPDLLISLHHNSTVETYDSNNATGVVVYYYYGFSEELAINLADGISEAVDRLNDGAAWSYYIVTKDPICPSVLTEIGFMVNPEEYEKVTDSETLLKTGTAIANAVLTTLRTTSE